MMTVSLSEMLPSAVEAYAASGAAPVGAALRCASLCAAGMLAAPAAGKEPAGGRNAGTAPFRAWQNACSSPARGACHHGGHRAAQFARGILTLFTNAADSALGPSLALAIALHNIPRALQWPS